MTGTFTNALCILLRERGPFMLRSTLTYIHSHTLLTLHSALKYIRRTHTPQILLQESGPFALRNTLTHTNTRTHTSDPSARKKSLHAGTLGSLTSVQLPGLKTDQYIPFCLTSGVVLRQSKLKMLAPACVVYVCVCVCVCVLVCVHECVCVLWQKGHKQMRSSWHTRCCSSAIAFGGLPNSAFWGCRLWVINGILLALCLSYNC
jgi:hypothetical protein